MRILRDWKDMPREKLLLAFEAGHFAGVEEMKKSERLFQRVAPMGVNDIMMAVQYRHDPTLPPLNIPIIAFDGAKDNTIPNGYMKGWRKHTSKKYRHVIVDGTHYFVSTHYRFVTGEVGRECMELMEGWKGGIMGAGHSWVGGTGEASTHEDTANANDSEGSSSGASGRSDGLLQTAAAVATSVGEARSMLLGTVLVIMWVCAMWVLWQRRWRP